MNCLLADVNIECKHGKVDPTYPQIDSQVL